MQVKEKEAGQAPSTGSDTTPHDADIPSGNVTAVSTSTSVASAVATSSRNTLQQNIGGVSRSSTGNQSDSLADSTRISQLGANHAGTMAAYFCAEGATMIGKDDNLSASDFAACRKYFDTADALKQKGGSKAIQPDPAVSNAEGAQGILDEFSKRYGITGEEYLDRMLGPGGGRGELSDMLSKRLSSAALDQAFARADQLRDTGAEDKFAVSLALGGKSSPERKLSSELRAQLQQKLEKPAEVAHEAGAAKPAREKLGHLEPMRAEDVFSGSAAKDREITIFDVVRRKYHEISRRLGLVPFN